MLSQNAAYAADTAPLPWTANEALSREVAYAITSYIHAEKVGQPRRDRLRLLVDQALGHIDQWFVQRSSSTWAPFMFGLTSEALILYYEEIEQDPRIIEKLKLAASTCWTLAWRPAEEGFFYRADSPSAGAPDLNMLIAPAYAWLYKKTGDLSYRAQADLIFAGGVRGAWLAGAKQYNQSYRWAFDYVGWRIEGDVLHANK
jgi:hypothetical protein